MSIVSINNGYFATKVKTDSQEFMFESKVEKCTDDYRNSVLVNGQLVSVGAGSRDIDLDKTSSLVQKACIINALDKIGLRSVKIMTSLPVNSYLNTTAREQYIDFVRGLSPTISDVRCYMEGAAATISDLGWYKNRLVALLDIGGLTINALVFENGNLIKDTAISLNLGTIILENRIRTELAQRKLWNVTEYQIPYLFETEDIETKVLIDEVIENYIQEMKQELKKKGYPTSIGYRCTGGGALKLHDYLTSHLSAYISNDAVWENVRGLHVVGSVMFR